MATINLDVLSQFSGSEKWYKHWLGGVIYTDGIHYLVENGAAWLVDAIASYQKGKLLEGDLKDFQIWTLEVADRKALLTCQADSDQKPVVSQKIEYTDFPEGKIKLYLELGSIDGINLRRILMLPSER